VRCVKYIMKYIYNCWYLLLPFLIFRYA
jgi:hypothetical protein